MLPKGELHPDLVNRLAQEAAKSASHVLNMCVRALDYCPPVDITFGEYLRALITADLDLMPDDKHRYRVAFIEAFRRRGIYPRDVRTLSEDSLRWARPEEDPRLKPGEMKDRLKIFISEIGLRSWVGKLRYLKTRQEIWRETRDIKGNIVTTIRNQVKKAKILQRLTGLALDPSQTPKNVKQRDGQPVFSVQAIRESRRERGDGRVLNQVFITLLQKEIMIYEDQEYAMRCGSVLVIDLDEEGVSYVIRKGLNDQLRLKRTAEYEESKAEMASLAATYLIGSNEPFAALHSIGA